MSGMMRTVGTIAGVVGAIALIGTGIGAALGGTMVLAGVGSASTIAAVAGGVSAAASIGAQLTAKKPSNDRQGFQLAFKIEPDGPIEYLIGRTATGGTVVHRETYGTDNHYETYFVDLGLGPVQGIETFLADRSPVSFSGTSALGYYNRWMWQDRQLGAMPEPRALGHGVVSPPFGSIPAQVPGWSAAHKLSGHVAASLTMLFDTKARRYANGEPLPGWVVLGNLVWDPRQDSTYPGGSGPCRRDQPATWVYSETPALHGLKWRLGIYQNGKKIMGVGAPVELIDLPRIVESANVQEANGWKVGGVLNSGMGRWEALKLIEQAGGAEPVPMAAMMSTLQKMPRVAVGEITAADIIGRTSIPGSRPRRERINGFRARFRSEAHGWEMVPIDLVQIADYVAADGVPRAGSGDYALVQIKDQAAQLAAYEVYDSREIGPIELEVKPRFIAYRIGDALTINSPEHGLVNQMVVVRGRRIDPATGIVTLRLVTETAGKHAEALGMTGKAPPVPKLTYDPMTVAAPAASDWTAIGGTIQNDAGYTIPAIVITGAVANSAADGVVFDFRKVGESDWTNPSIDAPDTARKVIADVAPETAYEVGVRYKVAGVIGDRLILPAITTGKDSTADGLASAVERIAAMGSDNVLSAGSEKQQAIIDRGALTSAASALVQRYLALGSPPEITDAKVAADAALSALTDYLAPLLSDPSTDSPVNSAEWRSRWGDAYSAVNTLAAAITGRKGDKGDPGANAPLVLTQWSADGATGWHADYVDGSDYFQRQSNDNGATWGPAVRVVGESAEGGADGISPSIVFRRSATIPGTPARDTGNPPPGWSDAPPAGTDLLWQSVSRFRAGAQIADWSAPVRITGPQGTDGISPPLITLTATGVAGRFNSAGAYIGGPLSFTATHKNFVGNYCTRIVRVSDGAVLDAATNDGFSTNPAYFAGSAGTTFTMTAVAVRDYLNAHGPIIVVAYSDQAPADVVASETVYRVQDGADGRNGIDGANGAPGPAGAPGAQGAPGAPGASTYFHTAYANSANGATDFTTGAPGARAYLGVRVDTSPTDSENYQDYTWSLIRGADGLNGSQGVPGAPGANGQPSFVHFAYSNAADGSVDFSTDDPTGRAYIGVYSDYTSADSVNPASYTWSRAKGADGAPGPAGPQGETGNGAPAYGTQDQTAEFGLEPGKTLTITGDVTVQPGGFDSGQAHSYTAYLFGYDSVGGGSYTVGGGGGYGAGDVSFALGGSYRNDTARTQVLSINFSIENESGNAGGFGTVNAFYKVS